MYCSSHCLYLTIFLPLPINLLLPFLQIIIPFPWSSPFLIIFHLWFFPQTTLFFKYKNANRKTLAGTFWTLASIWDKAIIKDFLQPWEEGHLLENLNNIGNIISHLPWPLTTTMHLVGHADDRAWLNKINWNNLANNLAIPEAHWTEQILAKA